MTHKMIYEKFLFMFPLYDSMCEMYFPNGKNCIRIRLNDKKEFVFTYNSEKDFFFESLSHYIERMNTERGK